MSTVNSTTPLADYTIANELKNTIVYIGKTFVDPKQSTVYIGGLDTAGLETKTDSSQLNYVEALAKGYVSFKARFLSSLPETVPADILKKIMVRKLNDKIYNSIEDNLASFSATNTEINFSKLLTPTGELLTILDKIKNVYTFLQDDTLKLYTAGIPFNVSNYMIDDQNLSHVKITSETKNAFLTKIQDVVGDMKTFDYVKNDVFMIRRLMLIYELLTNIYISMYLYDVAIETNADETISNNIRTVISNTGNVLIELNKNFIFTTNEDVPVRSRIVSNMNKKAQDVKASSQQINSLDERVRDLKMMLSNNNNLFKSGMAKSQNAHYYEKVMLGIFITSFIVIIAVSISPIERNTKLLVDCIVLVVLIVTAYIVDYLYRKKIEGFVGTLLGDPSTATVGTAREIKDSVLASYDNTYKSEALNFLSISIYLGLMLQSGRSYSGIDAAMKREISYFTQMTYMIDNVNDKVYNATSLTQLDSVTSAAKITFFVSMGIILGGATIAYVIIGENLKYQPFVLGVAGFLILFALAKYLYEITRRVRNDPYKFYWNRPSNMSRLD